METFPQTVPQFVLLVRARNENCYRRLDAIGCCEASLIHGHAQTPARIDIQQWLLQRNVAEGAHERNIDLGLGDGDVYRLAPRITEFEKIFAADIGDKIS